jgi:hypothetical protein
MSRRRKVLAALAAGGLLLALLVPLAAPLRRQVHIDRAACDRVKPGMSEAEVEAVLGGPPGCYTGWRYTAYTAMGGTAMTNLLTPGGHHFRDWQGNEGCIMVGFDRDDRVVEVIFKDYSWYWRLQDCLRDLRRWFQ